MSQRRFLHLRKLGILCVLFALPLANLRAADGDAALLNGALPAPDSGSNEALRAYLQLQEQIHETQLTIERSRQQAQAAAAQEAVAVSNRLQALEDTMVLQRANELEEAHRTNQLLLAVIGVFAVVGFAAVLLTVYFQSRAVSRLADISTALSTSRGLAFSASTALTLDEHGALSHGSVEQSNARLVDLVQRLEERIAELEQTTSLPLKEPTAFSNGDSDSHPELALNSDVEGKSGRIAKLLEQGQSYLSAERPEEAIASFDQILSFEPNHAEALVKKGTALEKLRQPQDALDCYDRAIAADASLTIAYLHKGGLCSRLEKYGEAMECYERALHTQEKKQAA
jgi:tetratricopeptide (TPR) repeat protein